MRRRSRRVDRGGQVGKRGVVTVEGGEGDGLPLRGLRHGASGFLVEDTEPPDLTNAVRVVASGDSLISPRMTRRLIGEFATRAKQRRPAGELDVLSCRAGQPWSSSSSRTACRRHPDRADDLGRRPGARPARGPASRRPWWAPSSTRRHIPEVGAKDRAATTCYRRWPGDVRTMCRLISPACRRMEQEQAEHASPRLRGDPLLTCSRNVSGVLTY